MKSDDHFSFELGKDSSYMKRIYEEMTKQIDKEITKQYYKNMLSTINKKYFSKQLYGTFIQPSIFMQPSFVTKSAWTHKTKMLYENEMINEDSLTIIGMLHPKPIGSDFANGESGYIQHDIKDVKLVTLALLNIAKRTISHHFIGEAIKDTNYVNIIAAGRLIEETDKIELRNAWRRICCINHNTGREYGQQYFVLNPSRVKDVCLNKKQI